MVYITAKRPTGAFDFDSNLYSPFAEQKGHPVGWPFCLAKDCDSNKIRVIVDFYQVKNTPAEHLDKVAAHP